MSASMDDQALAEAVCAHMLAHDAASRALGVQVQRVAPGQARLTMLVRDDMLNGVGTCHGGLIASLADSAFAFACNSRNALTVAAGFAIDILKPALAGDVLLAEAAEVALAGRSGVCDVKVSNQHGDVIALFRGKSRQLHGKAVLPCP